ncbi:MaoC family dehydratase [Thiotrichales bacterium 19S3-7]|nr:MaoC family dehydratase [Thiotrichales bacterium 19S3-7]MCF6801127.1 MaoC family dehydratase [Thiotrichales bacterium 19S3-11]
MVGQTISELKVGQSASFSKTITETDIYLFAGVSGDLNPAHIDEEKAKDTRFKKRIAHGMLTASFISTVIGMQLPGPGTIYLEQSIRFRAPVYIGDTIKAVVTITEVDSNKNRVKLDTFCYNQDEQLVVEGYAQVMPPSKEQPLKKVS